MDLRKFVDTAQRQVSTGYDHGMEAVLDRLGLQQKRDPIDVVLPALGIFAAGITVGAMLGLMFAPKRGEDLRNDIRHKIADAKEKSAEGFEEIQKKSQSLLDSAKAPAEEA